MWIIAKRRPPFEEWTPVCLFVTYPGAQTAAWNLAKMDPESTFILSPCFDTYEEWEKTERPEGSFQFTGELQYVSPLACEHGILNSRDCLACRQRSIYG